ncbi:hypothetical protein [Fructobacillus americanaquae]|uniref:Uncharacterized protein n=1 Tax=Fructobacillus americanaquae TaxID=2940302 RepID=A0ABY5BZX7_9LACO|nr:hypothetical protein [Fructobacillus americanaquae]USS92045.1 hypothetical protein M3M36_00035 [Fructobacillus americanaquae]
MPAWYLTNFVFPNGFKPTETAMGNMTIGNTSGLFAVGTDGILYNRNSSFYKNGNNGGDSNASGFAMWVTLDDFPE